MTEEEIFFWLKSFWNETHDCIKIKDEFLRKKAKELHRMMKG